MTEPAGGDQAERNPAECPFEVERAIMVHEWLTLTFLHWSFAPEDVQRLLPPGLEVQTVDGRAWVGLVPFFMKVSLPRTGSVPWFSQFCETNVRTYVRDATGREGIWFFSLEAARLSAVVTARATYRLPYFWSSMRLRRDGNTVRYDSRRRWPGPRDAVSSAVIEVGERYAPEELTAFDHFLTARWVLFSSAGGHQRFARAAHAPWELYRARATEVHDELLSAAGLPTTTDAPLVHYSPGVKVRIGVPEGRRRVT